MSPRLIAASLHTALAHELYCPRSHENFTVVTKSREACGNDLTHHVIELRCFRQRGIKLSAPSEL